MIFIIGAGPGDPDLITVKGQRILAQADCVIYAGSLVNPQLMSNTKSGCTLYNSASMTLEEVIQVMLDNEQNGLTTARLHTGDPSIYGAIKEQIDLLEAHGVPCQVIPGVSSFSGAAASLGVEYTLPGISQTVILTRMEGRTPVPSTEGIAQLARAQASMVIFLSSGMLQELSERLLEGGYCQDTPVALVYKATWSDEKVVKTTLGAMAQAGLDNGIEKTALVLVGDFLAGEYQRSLLYDPKFSHGFREAVGESSDKAPLEKAPSHG